MKQMSDWNEKDELTERDRSVSLGHSEMSLRIADVCGFADGHPGGCLRVIYR